MTRVSFAKDAIKALLDMDKARSRKVDAAFKQFAADPRHPGLHFERLRGTADLYSIRLGRGDRAILRRASDADGEVFEVLGIGTHDIYKAIGRL